MWRVMILQAGKWVEAGRSHLWYNAWFMADVLKRQGQTVKIVEE